MGDFWHERILRVGVGQERADRKQNLGDGQGWGPLVLEDIKADGTMGVDVWMVNSGGERDLWRLERIVDWEVDVEEEKTALVRRVFRASDGGLPVVQIRCINWSGGAGERWVLL